jgi:multidrug efflux pump subunit AcrB
MIRSRAAVALIVLSVAIGASSLALAVWVILVRLHAGAAAEELPAVTVEAVYPGATASVAEEKLAGPLENQIMGIEHLRRLRSRCGHDGAYRLEASFAPGTDIDLALKLVENRVAVAFPALPTEIQNLGLTVLKPSPGLLMLICVYSRDASVDAEFLSNYANAIVKIELARVPGISRVTVLGAEVFSVRIRLDLNKLVARELTIADVARAVDSQDLGANDGLPAGPGGTTHAQPGARGGPGPIDQLEPLVVKTGPDGRAIRLRDVATRVEYGSSSPAYSSLDGKPVAVLAVYPFGPSQPREVSSRVRAKLAEAVRELFPPGIEASTDFDFSQSETAETSGFLLIDVDPGDGLTADSIARLLSRGGQSLSGLDGVRNVLALAREPFDRERDQPCLVARLGPANGAPADRTRLVGEIRALFPGGEKAPSIRIRDLSEAAGSLQSGYPIHFAIVGPDRARAQTLAGQLITRLSQDRRFIDLWSDRRLVSVHSVDIDRAKASAMGVSPAEISMSIQRALGQGQTGSVEAFGRTWPIWVEVDSGRGSGIDVLEQLRVRNDKGAMVPVSSVATIREDRVPDRLERIDLLPAISITANPARGFSLAEARFVCERLAEEILAKEHLSDYRLTWLREMPAARAPARLARQAAVD